MTYIPHSPKDIEYLLKECGLKELKDVFAHIPDLEKIKVDNIDIPLLTDKEIVEYFQECARQNIDMQNKKIFLGGGCYFHYIPSVVDYLSSRGEFVTSYTPYQPEASQGSLQAFYDFQTLIGRLTGYPAVTLGHYDGATALSEMLIILAKLKEVKEVCCTSLLNPHIKEVVNTYTTAVGINVIEVPHKNYTIDVDDLESFLKNSNTQILVIQQPNFFGFLEDVERIIEIAKKLNILTIYFSLEPSHFGLFLPPGRLGYDLAIFEGQSFGLYPNFGGPFIGIIASTNEYLRYLPGRLVGKTVDANNQTCYTLTLQTREQHIRREKSYSNICTNEGVLAIRVAIYLASLGIDGLKKIATINYDYAHYLYENILSTGKVEKISDNDFYNEFTVKTLFDPQMFNKQLLESNIVGGLVTKNREDNLYTLCCTELLNKEAIDKFITLLRNF